MGRVIYEAVLEAGEGMQGPKPAPAPLAVTIPVLVGVERSSRKAAGPVGAGIDWVRKERRSVAGVYEEQKGRH